MRTVPAEQIIQLPVAELLLDANVRLVQDGDVRELAESIRAHGVQQPIGVAALPDEPTPGKKTRGAFRVIFGYRRCRAAKLARLRTIPARVLLGPKAYTEEEFQRLQLLENLHRVDLKPIEEGRALQKLVDTGLSQVAIAKSIGKSQPYVANRIRLLGLPPAALRATELGQLAPTHAELMLQLPKEATPGEVQGLVDYARSREPNTRDFGALVRQRAGTINDRTRRKQRRRAALAKAKHPVCPVKSCGKNGSPSIGYDGTVEEFNDRNGHRWNPATGKLLGRAPSAARAPPAERDPEPEPTLPLVLPDIPSVAPVESMLRRILDAGFAVDGLRWDPPANGDAARLILEVKPKGELVLLPGFEAGAHWKFVRASGCQPWMQRTDATRKRAAAQRTRLETWLGTIRGRGRPKGEPAPPAPPSDPQPPTVPPVAPAA